MRIGAYMIDQKLKARIKSGLMKNDNFEATEADEFIKNLEDTEPAEVGEVRAKRLVKRLLVNPPRVAEGLVEYVYSGKAELHVADGHEMDTEWKRELIDIIPLSVPKNGVSRAEYQAAIDA